MAPKDVSKDNETQVWVNLYGKRLSHKQRKRSKVIVGDFVKLSIEKAPFMKRYSEIWTEEVFVIEAIVYGNPTTYKIKDQDNKPIKETFYEQEFQFVLETKTYRIKNVIRKKKESNCVLYI